MTDREFEELYRSIISLRSSIDVTARSMRLRRDPIFADALKSMILQIEAIRFDLNSVRRTPDSIEPRSIQIARDGLITLAQSPLFDEIAPSIRFRLSMPLREEGSSALRDPNLSVADALAIILRMTDEIIKIDSISEFRNTSQDLRRVLPKQKLAPAIFDIIGGKLIVSRQPPGGRPEDEKNIENAKDTLIQRGGEILKALEISNCDRRIVERMRELQDHLEAHDNIIELGLMNMAVERVCKGAAEELPEAVLGAIEGQTAGIGMYVAQFPEWQRFSENAASIELDASDIEQIGHAAQAVIDRLIEQPEIADAEVPRTLRALKALIANPILATKRAAFAVLRTVENLVAKIYDYGANFLDKTAKKTIDGLSIAASTAIIGGLMTVALAATANLGGVTLKISEASWMKSAAEIVKAQIDEAIK